MDVVNGTYVGEGQGGTFCSQNTYLQRPLDYGPADQDIRQRFVASYIYELPFGKKRSGWTKAARRARWQVAGSLTASPRFNRAAVLPSIRAVTG
jgi:hypothetical protein